MSLIEVHDLTAGYGSHFRIGPITFAAGTGLIHLQGPNGGGKTTLLRTLCGGLRPIAGRVEVAGHNVHQVVGARRRIALVPSIPELPDFLTVEEALQFTAAIRSAQAWDGSALCTAFDLPSTLPLVAASAGQRHKAELLCGLVGDPDVLLLDEPFVHLDAASTQRLWSLIAQWTGAKSVILVHHGALPVIPGAILHVDRERFLFQPA